jgi:two-component system LytT family response regulator
MKMKALLVDDEVNNSELLRYFIDKYCPDVKVIGQAEDLEKAREIYTAEAPNLLFLDIELGQSTNGFELLSYIDPATTAVIFVTAFSEYALQALKHQAVDYLLKPINIEELQQAVMRARTRLRARDPQEGLKDMLRETLQGLSAKPEEDFIAVPYMDKIELLKKKDIQYMASSGSYSKITTRDNTVYWSSRNLGEYEKILTGSSFIRVHHSYIINIAFLRSIDKTGGWTCVMQDGTLVPISRRKKDDLYSRLNLRLEKD